MAQPAAKEQPSVAFRKMSLFDVNAVYAIEQASFPAPWRRKTFFTRLVLSDHYGYVAEVGGRIVGYVFFQVSQGRVHLQKIAVAEECRRRGIATQLMHVMLEKARAAGGETVFLEVRVSNCIAQEFYKKLNFSLHHIEPNYYLDNGEAAHILILDLAPVVQPEEEKEGGNEWQ